MMVCSPPRGRVISFSAGFHEKIVASLIARIFATSLANGLVFESPCGQAGVEVIFVGMDQRTLTDAGFDDGLDSGLPNVGQHLQDDVGHRAVSCRE